MTKAERVALLSGLGEAVWHGGMKPECAIWLLHKVCGTTYEEGQDLIAGRMAELAVEGLEAGLGVLAEQNEIDARLERVYEEEITYGN